MEVINVLKTGQDTNDLYSQNNDILIPCKFENRDQTPLDINSIKYYSEDEDTNSTKFPYYSNSNPFYNKEYESQPSSSSQSYSVNDNYSKEYIIPKTPNNIPNPPFTNTDNINNHYQLLVNTNDITKNTSLINISDKYKEGDNQVNFERKNYKEVEGVFDLLLSKTNYVEGESVTNANTYENKDFWSKQQPNIQLGEYMFRDSVQQFYDKDYKEGFISGEYPMGKFANKKKNVYARRELVSNYSEPKVSGNYVTNYTENDNKVVHEGKAINSMNKNKYVIRDNTYKEEDLVGNNLYYYNDNVSGDFDKNFSDIKLELNEYENMSGGKYRKFENNNVKDSNLTEYEQNIMLNRNNIILASINNIARYEY
jgi:hypothetical protein